MLVEHLCIFQYKVGRVLFDDRHLARTYLCHERSMLNGVMATGIKNQLISEHIHPTFAGKHIMHVNMVPMSGNHSVYELSEFCKTH